MKRKERNRKEMKKGILLYAKTDDNSIYELSLDVDQVKDEKQAEEALRKLIFNYEPKDYIPCYSSTGQFEPVRVDTIKKFFYTNYDKIKRAAFNL